MITDDRNHWQFPEQVSFETVALFSSRLDMVDHSGTVVFDLGKTKDIHSSFIGFLIHAKQTITQSGGVLVLDLSPTVERLLAMLNILDFLTNGQPTSPARKTA